MGNPALHLSRPEAANLQRLVVLSPFSIDDREVTVAQFRASNPPLYQGHQTYLKWSGSNAGTAVADRCTFPANDDPSRDPLPMNCVTWTAAHTYCRSKGGELPSEAQFEYVAGALQSRDFSWGSDEPGCDDVVWGRGGIGSDSDTDRTCLADEKKVRPASIGGPIAIPNELDPASLRDAARLRARLDFGTGTIWDLNGNVSEWARDVYALQDEPCWSTENRPVFFDPVCQVRTTTLPVDTYAVRGGAWFASVYQLYVATRNVQEDASAYDMVGFRCVYSAPP